MWAQFLWFCWEIRIIEFAIIAILENRPSGQWIMEFLLLLIWIKRYQKTMMCSVDLPRLMSVHLGDWTFRYASLMLFESTLFIYQIIRSPQAQVNWTRSFLITRKTYWYIMHAYYAKWVLTGHVIYADLPSLVSLSSTLRSLCLLRRVVLQSEIRCWIVI